MDIAAVTDRVILGVTAALVLYNVVAGVIGGGDATISARIQYHAVRFPVIPMVIGGVVCHWFWPVFGVRD